MQRKGWVEHPECSTTSSGVYQANQNLKLRPGIGISSKVWAGKSVVFISYRMNRAAGGTHPSAPPSKIHGSWMRTYLRAPLSKIPGYNVVVCHVTVSRRPARGFALLGYPEKQPKGCGRSRGERDTERAATATRRLRRTKTLYLRKIILHIKRVFA